MPVRINARDPALEERMAKVEGILEEVRTRLNHLESGFEHLRARVDSGFTELRRELEANTGELRREMQSQIRWTLGIMLGVLIPMWVTIILTVISP